MAGVLKPRTSDPLLLIRVTNRRVILGSMYLCYFLQQKKHTEIAVYTSVIIFLATTVLQNIGWFSPLSPT